MARLILSDQAWAYYSSAGDDEVTKHQNRSSYSRVWFKPRVLRAVGTVDPSSSLLDGALATSIPVYVSPAALAKLGHPDGELNLTRAAGSAGIIQGISANASMGLDEMLDARLPGQPVFYQLYVNKDRAVSERILDKIQARGVSAVMLTVDAAVMGNRERDMRAKGEVVETGAGTGGSTQGGGVAQAISGYIDPDLVSGWVRLETGDALTPDGRAGRTLPGSSTSAPFPSFSRGFRRWPMWKWPSSMAVRPSYSPTTAVGRSTMRLPPSTCSSRCARLAPSSSPRLKCTSMVVCAVAQTSSKPLRWVRRPLG